MKHQHRQLFFGLVMLSGAWTSFAQEAAPTTGGLPSGEVLLDLCVNLVLGGAALGFAILHAFIFFFHPREKGNLYFSLFALALAVNGGFGSLQRYGSFAPREALLVRTVVALSAGSVFLFLVLFLSNIVSSRPPRWIRPFAATAGLVLLCYLVPPLSFLFNPVYLVFMVWSAWLSLWLPARALWLRIDGAWALGLAVAGWGLFLVGEVLKVFFGLSVAAEALGLGSGVLLIQTGFSAFLARRIARQGQNLEELNRHLEQRVEERTAELTRSEERERQANQAKSAFLATMSHEIRTPMNAVVGLSELLADSGLAPQPRRMAATIRSSARALLTILDDILDFSKIEAGSFDLERTVFDARVCMAEACELFDAQAAEKGLKLTRDPVSDLPSLLGDPTRIRQVLVNLIGNAIKFTERGGVHVSLEALPSTKELRELHFTIRDSGIGIAAERLEQLFDPFTQADSSTTRRFGGTGLGLTISKRLAEAMGGLIRADSHPGEGSAFHLILPVTVASATVTSTEATPQSVAPPPAWREATPASSTLAATSALADLRIVLAEDNEVNQMVTSLMLKRLGLRAETAANGAEVLALLAKHPCDIVLMDVQMPEVDGIEATRQIRQQTPPPLRPYIIALTAGAQAEDRQLCLAAGMDDFVSKPVRVADLEASLERAQTALGHRRL